MKTAKLQLEPLERYFRDVRVARASDLARRGKLREAFKVISPNDELPHNEQELHLLGKIAAQLKEYSIARQCWKYALKNSPDNKEYQSCLELVNSLMQKPTWVRHIRCFAVGGIIGILLILGISKSCSQSVSDNSPKSTQ